jgi:hypothetical protein
VKMDIEKERRWVILKNTTMKACEIAVACKV